PAAPLLIAYSPLFRPGVASLDDPAAGAENRRRGAGWFGGGSDDLAAPYQVHSAVALTAEAGWKGHRPEGDASVTAADGVICAVGSEEHTSELQSRENI